jgi:adenylate cyclase
MPDLSSGRRRLVGIVFTDIVRSTGLLHKLHTGLWVQLLAAHLGHLRRLMSQNGGHEVATTGDGVLATFPRATDALLFARAAVMDPGDERIGLRAGVHWGYVTEDEGAGLVAGRPVHFAARVMGQVTEIDLCVSDEAKHQIEVESPDVASNIQWTPQDNCELKSDYP